MFFLGAKKAREVVFSVLCDACIDGDLSVVEAIEAAEDIFAQNAIYFYKIKLRVKSNDSKLNVHLNNMKEIDVSENDVSLVRIIWVDASGQHRCRVSFLYLFTFVFLITLGFDIEEVWICLQKLNHFTLCMKLGIKSLNFMD